MAEEMREIKKQRLSESMKADEQKMAEAIAFVEDLEDEFEETAQPIAEE